MHSGNDKKGFDAEKWKRENTSPGGGIVLGAEGMRYDDHSGAARRVEERRRQSEQKNNSGGPKR
ncbi:MAG: hypothetical protein LBP77_03705 [Rickettsiales bacterium]|jgi:hypothetical protein|nr:hypothetical protein [Rickettsiales bacterium]